MTCQYVWFFLVKKKKKKKKKRKSCLLPMYTYVPPFFGMGETFRNSNNRAYEFRVTLRPFRHNFKFCSKIFCFFLGNISQRVNKNHPQIQNKKETLRKYKVHADPLAKLRSSHFWRQCVWSLDTTTYVSWCQYIQSPWRRHLFPQGGANPDACSI